MKKLMVIMIFTYVFWGVQCMAQKPGLSLERMTYSTNENEKLIVDSVFINIHFYSLKPVQQISIGYYDEDSTYINSRRNNSKLACRTVSEGGYDLYYNEKHKQIDSCRTFFINFETDESGFIECSMVTVYDKMSILISKSIKRHEFVSLDYLFLVIFSENGEAQEFEYDLGE